MLKNKMDKFTSLLFYLCLPTLGVAEYKIVCYYPNWAVYRPSLGQFDIGNINPLLCTHLIYAFLGLDDNRVVVLDPYQDLPDYWGKNGFNRFNALREKNPSAKTLVAIGGWNEGSVRYSNMASTAEYREAFVDSVVAFVKRYDFNGFDLDWEYPGQRGGNASDIDNYIELLKIMRKRFDEENLLLSAAVAAPETSAAKSYNIRELSKYLDFINLMMYDLHTASESKTAMNAPLYAAESEEDSVRTLNMNASINYWLSQGAQPDKLIVGMPTYGRVFTLADVWSTEIGAPSKGPGLWGPYTREPGMMGYNEICEKLINDGWSMTFDEERRVPYASLGDQWITYDNTRSIREKAEYIKTYQLGGAMIWSMDTDDFRGMCGEKYPILKTINRVLRGEVPVFSAEYEHSKALLVSGIGFNAANSVFSSLWYKIQLTIVLLLFQMI